MTTDFLSDWLAREHGLTGELVRLPGENENYLVTSAAGERVVAKLQRDADIAQLDIEGRAAALLAAAVPALGVPVAVPNRDGESVSRLPDGAVLRLLEFVPGTPWGEAGEASVARCRELGRVLACMARALGSLCEPAARRSHAWDLTAAEQHRDLVRLIEDDSRRAVLERAFHLFASCRPMLDELPRGFIHGDANDENVLVEGDRIVGILDFGDSLENPLVCDLAIALSYVMQHASDPLESAAHVVAGYCAERPMSAAELDVLYPLVIGRLAVTVTMCAARRAVDRDHATWFVSERTAWQTLMALAAVDPEAARVALGGDSGQPTFAPSADLDALLERRRRTINPSLSIAYREPIRVVRGRGQFLFDDRGRPFLDLVNNVCHVGHCHPRVVAAGQRQMARLNTNTRYVYDGLTDYAERLLATLPPELDTCFLLNSGTEANELAVRLARAHTGRHDMLVVDGAYHGHSSTLIAMSPYKFMGRGGTGRPEPWVHVAPTPDGYRGPHKGQGVDAGHAYGDEVGRVLQASERPIAGFVCESLFSCSGQIVPPDGYMARAFEHVRSAGGVCIADEVQVGFARVGTHFWAFSRQDVVPDIVVMGKPIGNGHPMAAVVTRSEIAGSFANGMEFFATFAGNPVSCAIGLAVIDVIEQEGLQQHALELGAHFEHGLRDLMTRHALIGDVRGVGLFLGVELVRDRATLEPATAEADDLANRMRRHGVLLSTDGPFSNVLKIKPPMTLTRGDVDMVLRLLERELDEIRA